MKSVVARCRRLLWFALVLAAPVSAGELRVMLDLDNDVGTGCSVTTSEGDFSGVETIVITRFDNNQVTGVALTECLDPGTDSFGPETPISPGGWPVGLQLGTDSSDLVETFVALADLGDYSPRARIGFSTRDEASAPADAVLGAGAAGFELALFVPEPTIVPSMTRVGLMLLALLLAGLSLYGIRRHPGVHGVVMVVVLAGSLVGLVWAAIVPDGDPADWGSTAPLSGDPLGDGGDDDLVAVFVAVENGVINLRGDLFWSQPPVIDDQTFGIDENSPNTTYVGTLAASDPDPGDLPQFSVIGGTGSTAFDVDGVSGDITVLDSAQLDHEVNASLTLLVQAMDGGGLADTALVTIDINNVNEPPVAVSDTATVAEDAAATAVAVLANDSDPEGDPLTIVSVTQPTNGTVVITGGGSGLTYQPSTNYCNNGVPTDDFTYTLNGGSMATVAVTVTCTDDPPVAVDDTATVTEDAPATTVDVLANDTNLDGGPMSIASVTQPIHGTVVNNGTDLTYEPDANYCNDQAPASTDDFTYTLTPGGSSATVRVTVSCVNDPPQVTGSSPAYSVTGNVKINVPPGSGLLASVTASDPIDGGTPSFSIGGTVPTSSAHGGELSISNDGSFIYDPPAGYTGSDSFQYRVCDDGIGLPASACSSPVTVNLTVSDRIWFVDNTAAAGGDGRLSAPFDTLADVAAAGLVGDSIFVYTGSGDYTGGLALKNNQILIGQGATTGLSAVSGISFATHSSGLPSTGGTRPVVANAGGDGLTLASGNKLQGLDVGNTSGIGVTGSGFGTLTVRDLSILGTGRVISLVNGTVDAVFTALSTSSAGGAAISLDTVAGPFTANGGSIANASGVAVDLNALTGDFTYAGSVSNGADRSVEVTNCGGAVANNILFTGAIADTGTGILLDNNDQSSGATVTFRGGIQLNTGANTAFRAINGGVVNLCPTADCAAGSPVVNSIGATTALSTTAVDINGTIIGASGVSFSTIKVDQGATGSDTSAVLLTNTGPGIFSVTGDGSTPGSGGFIRNITDVDAVRLSNTGGRVSFNYMTIEDIAHSGDGGAAIHTQSGVDGIHGENVSGGLTLSHTTLRRFSDMALNGSTLAGNAPTSFNGLDIVSCVLEDANRFHVANVGDGNNEGIVRIQGLTGVVNVSDSLFQRGARGMDLFSVPGAGTLSATIQGNQFLNLYKEFNAPINPRNVGNRGLSIQLEGSHDAVLRIGDPAQSNIALSNSFTNNMTASIVVAGNTGHSGNIDTVIHGSTIVVDDHTTAQLNPGNLVFDFPQGGVSLNPAGGTFEAIVAGNSFDQVMHAAGGVGQLTLGYNGGTTEGQVQDNNFILPWDGPVWVRAEGTTSDDMLFGPNPNTAVGVSNTYVDGTVGSASDDLGAAFQSPFLPFRVNVRKGSQSIGGALDLTLNAEVLPKHDTGSGFANSFAVEVQSDDAANDLDLFLQNNSGDYGYRLVQDNGALKLYRGVSAASSALTVLRDNGNTGGGGNPSAIPPTVATSGTITATNTAPVLPNIIIP